MRFSLLLVLALLTTVPVAHAATVDDDPLVKSDPSALVTDQSITGTPAGTPAALSAAPTKATAASARLRVTTRPDHRSVLAGGAIRYAITVRNAGETSAGGVQVCHRLANATTLLRAGLARVRAGAACFALGAMRAGATRTVHLTVSANAQRDAHRVRATARATAVNAAALVAQSPWTLVSQGTVGPAARTLR